MKQSEKTLDKISEALGAAEGVPTNQALTIDEKTRAIGQKASEIKQEDFDTARSNLQELIDQSMTLMPNLVSLVREAESPRMYESASSFIKMIADLNKDLLGLSSEATKGSKLETPPLDEGGRKEAAFIGTGGDLFKFLSRRNNQELLEAEYTDLSKKD